MSVMFPPVAKSLALAESFADDQEDQPGDDARSVGRYVASGKQKPKDGG